MSRTGTPLRVVYLGHSAAMSGAEIALLRLLETQTSVEPQVILGEDGPLVSALADRDIPVAVMPLPSPTAAVDRGSISTRRLPVAAATGAAAYTVRLARELRRRAPDLVHTNSQKAHLYGGVAARLARIPHVWHARDRAAPDYLGPQALRLVRLAARVLPRAVIANSRCTLDTYPGVVNGYVVHDCAPAHPRRRDDATHPLRVGIVGRLAPWKGQHVFLRAFATAFGDGDERAAVVGGTPFGERGYARALHELCRSLGIADRVEFTGHTDDVAAQLDRLHILVHCSTLPEPFGQVVIEGMAAGLPVIAAGAGGPSEVIEHGRTGLLVAAGDVAALAGALTRVAADADLRRRLGAAGRAASRAWRPQPHAARIAAVHERVVAMR